jgi:universal stress protein A
MKTILFPTDFSSTSDAALSTATSLARDRGAQLIILHVEEPPAAYAAGEWYYGPLEPDPGALRQMLDKIKPTDPNVPCIHELSIGEPAAEIVRVAEEENAEMIVMSTHGRTGLTRLLTGSVAEKVVRKAKCSVLVFKARPQNEQSKTKSSLIESEHAVPN